MNHIFTKKGAGEPVILLHGWGGSIESLEKLQEELSKYYEVYNLELPGHGELEGIDESYDFKKYLVYLDTFIRSNKLNNIILIGHSFGGNIAIRYTAYNENAVKTLVLINSSGIKPKNSLKKTFWKSISMLTKPLLALPGGEVLRKIVYKGLIREQDYLKTSGFVRETFKNVTNDFVNKRVLDKIKNSTLILWGRYDTYTPLWMGKYLKENIKNSELEILDAKHGLPLKYPSLVSEKINNFIKRQ